MSTTLTIRTDKTLRNALVMRAKSQGKSVSEFVREILEEAVLERPLGEKIGHLRGGLRLDHKPSEKWRRQIHDRNWR